MKFVKEDIQTYIKRLVEANNLDTSKRRITEVHVNRADWLELTKGQRARMPLDCVRIALPALHNINIRDQHAPSANSTYQFVTVVLDPSQRFTCGEF